MRGVECVAHTGEILVGKSEGMRPIGRFRHRLDNNIKWILNKWGVMMWNGFIWLGTGFSGSLL
jgi:hypothetical protein